MINSVDQRENYKDTKSGQPGLKIARVVTTYPDEVTIVLEGGKHALDLSIFEVPIACYPLIKNDRILVLPMFTNGAATRYGVLSKLNGGPVCMATMKSGNSLQFDGMDGIYTAEKLVIPPYLAVGNAQDRYTDPDAGSSGHSSYYLIPTDIRPLQADDRVSVCAITVAGVIKYIILQRY